MRFRRTVHLRRTALVLLGGLTAAGCLFGRPAGAAPPELEFPVACTVGVDCWLFQYFDHAAGPEWRDYACGKRSYDGHHGTDIALRDEAAIRDDVAVLAAAPGTVRNVRDGMADVARMGGKAQENIAGRECGNGVAIAHGDGWETQYCHLRKGSVRVRPGQAVSAGDVLGFIGLSGNTQFPHVDISVRHAGRPVDPFVGESRGDDGPAACGPGPGQLWSARALDRVGYSPVDILAAGLYGGTPKPEDAYAGRLVQAALRPDAPALVAWTTLGAVRRGDRLDITVIRPDGSRLAEQQTVIDRDRIRYFAYAGVRRREAAWPAGLYRALVRLERVHDGKPLVRETNAAITVEP